MALTIANLSFKLSAHTASMQASFKSTSKDLDGLGKATKKSGTSFVEFSDTITRISFKFNQVRSALKGLWNTLISVSAEARDFGGAFNKSLAIMEDVDDVMRGKLIKAMQQASFSTTTLSMKDMADALYFLASAGLDAEKSLTAMGKVATFAQAGAFDVATATELLGGAQSAMGLASKDAAQHMANMQRVMDALTRANTLSNASIQQFSEAMSGGAAAMGRAFSQDLEQVLAVLAAYATQNTKGAEGATTYAVALRDLTSKALINKEAFASAGVAVFDAAGKTRFFGDILADLEGHLDGMSDAQKKAALTTLGFSDKSVLAILKVVGMSDAINNEYLPALREAGGFTERVANKSMGEFKSAIEAVNTSIESLKIKFLPPVLAQVGKAINLVMNSLRGLHGEMGKSRVRIVAMVAGFAAGVALAPRIISAVIAITKAIRNLAAGQAILQAFSGPAGLASLAIGAAAATAAVVGINAVMDDLDSNMAATQGALKDVGVTVDDSVASITDMTAAIDGATEATKEVAKATTDWEAVGKRIKDSVATPMEKYREKVDELRQAVVNGAISWETFNRAANAAVNTLHEATKAKKDFNASTSGVGAALAGTTAGFSAVQESRRSQSDQAKIAASQLAEAKSQTKLLERIRREVEVDMQIKEVRL